MKTSRNGFITVCLVIFAIYIYIQFLSEPGFNEDVSLPEGLHPEVADNAELLVRQAAEKGINITITDDFRSYLEQDQLYEIGRTEGGNIVTHAQGGESYHNFGLAIDFALKENNGRVVWDMNRDGNGNSKSDWMEVVAIAKGLGFEWGGDWKQFKDYPHLQMNFGLSIRDLQRGKRPPEQSLTAENS